MRNRATNNEKFMVTHTQDDGEYSRHLNFLLSDGSRRRVTIESASDSEETRQRIGAALHLKEVEGKPWRNRLL
jgi:hypothetical protein